MRAAIPLSYSMRSLVLRRGTSALTVLSMSLLMAILLPVLSLTEAIEHVFQGSGSPDNLLVLQTNARTEAQSLITPAQAALLTALTAARDRGGGPLVSTEVFGLLNMRRKAGPTANVVVRGVSPAGRDLRPAFALVAGRLFTPGVAEVVVSRRILERFEGCRLGAELPVAPYHWTVVGVFEGGGTAIESEIWTDAAFLREQLRRDGYSSILLRTEGPADQRRIIEAVAADPRLALAVKPENAYYADQTEVAAPIKYVGLLLAGLMAAGAVVAATSTMTASVWARTREIATLRVLGFSRRAVLASFVFEALVLGLSGGLVGSCLGAAIVAGFLSGDSGTTNFATLSEVIFTFRVTARTLTLANVCALAMGLAGGLLPAGRAALTPAARALREPG